MIKTNLVSTDLSRIDDWPITDKGNYIIVLNDGWPTIASMAIGHSLSIWGKKLKHHLLINPSGEALTNIRKKIKCTQKEDPALLLTTVKPAELSVNEKEKYMIFSLKNIKNNDTVIDILRKLTLVIDDDDFIKEANQIKRKEKIKRFFIEYGIKAIEAGVGLL